MSTGFTLFKKVYGFLPALPLIIFAFMSHHTLLDLASEIQRAKKHRVLYILRWDMFLLSLIVILIGIIPYTYFGSKLITFNYGNILLSYEFSRVPMIVCNSLIVIFVFVNNILKFKPAKDVVTCILRDSYRDSSLWNTIAITGLHLLQTITSCILVKMKIQLNSMCTVIAILSAPLIYLIFPFIAYHMVFYYDRLKTKRRIFYLLLAYIGLFINISVIGYMVLNLFRIY